MPRLSWPPARPRPWPRSISTPGPLPSTTRFTNSGSPRDGEFDILIGASSADIRCVETVTLQSTVELPCILDDESTVREWLEDPRGRPVFEPMFQQMPAQMHAVFGGGDEGESAIGMDTELFFMDMPLSGILHFQEESLLKPADVMIEELLRQVYESVA